MLKARDIMNDHLVTARPDWSVRKVIDLLLEEDVSSVLIVDENGRLVGLVAESVLLVAACDMQLQSDPISLHMQRRFIAAAPNEPIGQLTEKFLLHRVRFFPVVENRKLVGSVSRRELLRATLGLKNAGETHNSHLA